MGSRTSLLSTLAIGEQVAVVVVAVLPFLIIGLLYRSFRRRRNRGVDGYL